MFRQFERGEGELSARCALMRAVSPVPGLQSLGVPRLNSRKSGMIYGVGDNETDFMQTALSDRGRF